MMMVRGGTNRRIQRDVLGDAGGVAGLGLEDVAVDAVGVGFLDVLAGAALVHELLRVLVFFGVQHVGALGAKEDIDGHRGLNAAFVAVNLLGVASGIGWGGHGGKVSSVVFCCSFLLSVGIWFAIDETLMGSTMVENSCVRSRRW